MLSIHIRIAVILFSTLLCITVYAQEDEKGQLTIIQDPLVDTLLSKHLYLNEQNPGIDGWRIQIFFEAGNYSKTQAMEAKTEFVSKYPDLRNYLIFQEPYYKVRIGDYRTKIEAEKVLKEIIDDYPNAFVVKDEINFPELD